MDDKLRIKIVSGIDIFIGVFFFIIGILVIILGSAYLDQISGMSAYSYSPIPIAIWSFPWIIIMLGLTSLIYGIKRIIDDILKTMV